MSVGARATLVWAPGPVIAAHGCDHHSTTRIVLAPGARLMVIDELVLGRHRERCGTIRQRLRVCLGDRPLHDQELRLGPNAMGSAGPAVTGGRTAVGSVLIIDPTAAHHSAFRESAVRGDVATARFPLATAEPAALITSLAFDLPALRQSMKNALADLEGVPQPVLLA